MKKRIHKLLFGEGAGTYLPFALSRLKELERINKDGAFSQTFIVDSATINVRQIGRDQYIRIYLSGGFYFEFATSGYPVGTKEIDGAETLGFGTSQYTRLVVGTDVTTDNGSIVIKPVVREQKRGDTTSRNWFLQQIQLINEPVRYVEADPKLRAKGLYPLKLYEAYAPGHSHTGFGERSCLFRSKTFEWASGLNGTYGWQGRDVTEDYPSAWSRKFDLQTYALVHGEVDWWRAGGYRVVTSEKWGSRAFVLIGDGHGQITAVPTTEVVRYDLPSSGNVNYEAVKTIKPTLPTWVWASTTGKMGDWFTANPNPDEFLVEMPDYDWKFSPDGTKACVVCYARAAFENDDTFFSTNPDPDTPWRQEDFDRLTARMFHRSQQLVFSSGPGSSAYKPEHYFYAPGMLEVEIDIELTGSDPEDFNLSIKSLTEHRNPTAVDSRAVFFAGYAHMDIPSKGVSYGDLLCVDVESYSPNNWTSLKEFSGFDGAGRLNIDPATVGTRGTFSWTSLSFKNMTTGGNEVWCVREQPVLAIDINTMSLAMKVCVDDPYNAATYRDLDGSNSTAGHRWTQEFGVAIFFAGSHKETLFPDSMTDAKKAMVREEVEKMKNSRALLTAWLEADPDRQLVPLNAPEDGWTGFINARAVLAEAQFYWYNEPWVQDDPRYEVHGTIDNYPDGGWVRYRTSGASGTSVVADLDKWQSTYLAGLWLMFCNNPKFGWVRYMRDIRNLMNINSFTTFFTHPNGTFAFWCNHLLYDQTGVMNITENCLTGYNGNVYFFDSLEGALDSAKWEHCIFDRIHLEVPSPVGKVATLDTTFLAMYNQAVQKGLDDRTLEEGISTMTKSNMQGVIKLEKIPVQYTDTISYKIQQIELEWMGKKWYYFEPTNRGEFTEELYPFAFFQYISGNLIGYQLDCVWASEPIGTLFQFTGASPPVFTNLLDPSTLMVRFCNPQVITG